VDVTGGDHPIYPGLIEAQQEAERANELDAQRYLQQLADSLAGKGISVQLQVLRGATERSLERLADQLSDNMIALASHGRSGWPGGCWEASLKTSSGRPATRYWSFLHR
jgi:nucleotide-binding universal stress UspA family protein